MENIKNNGVLLKGMVISELEISHELFGEKFYKCTLRIKRTSDAFDEIVLTISERLLGKEKQLIKGKYYEVLGQIRTYNKYIGNRNKLMVTVFVRAIEQLDAEANENEVFLDGFICKPVNYRKTPLGREISDVILAVNRQYNKSDYIPVITWGRNAVYSKDLEVGNNIKIIGRVQSRAYEKKFEDGTVEKMVAFEISVSSLQLAE